MVNIAVLKEYNTHEKRVAISAETAKKFVDLGTKIIVQSGAGDASFIADNDYKDAGATIESDANKILKHADILLAVQPEFDSAILENLRGKILVSMLNPLGNSDYILKLAEAGVTAFGMEMVPRITRAQSMDVLSSQSNLAGYRAVLDAFYACQKVMPMMMTAAGTIQPGKVLILGAGVAGLQAIATAKRLGAIVSAFDVRPAVKEQVESLGANFIEVESEETEQAETAGGYAKEMSDDYKKKQQALIEETVKSQDIIISTALIPGKPAPVLIPETIVKQMRPGSVIVDLAVSAGGNCPLSKPNEVIEAHGVTIIGYENLPSRVPIDASALYAKNLLHFVSTLIDQDTKEIVIDEEDEIIKGCLLTKEGKVVHAALNELVPSHTKKKEPATKAPPKKVTKTKPHLKKKAASKKSPTKKTGKPS